MASPWTVERARQRMVRSSRISAVTRLPTYDDLRALPDVHAGEAKVRARPFDAIELELSLLWAR
jgi:hypothetical protein